MFGRSALSVCCAIGYVAAAFGLTSCSRREVVVHFDVPAQISLGDVAKIGIGPFFGVDGEDFADALTDSLHRANHYDVVVLQRRIDAAASADGMQQGRPLPSAFADAQVDAIFYGTTRRAEPVVSYTAEQQSSPESMPQVSHWGRPQTNEIGASGLDSAGQDSELPSYELSVSMLSIELSTPPRPHIDTRICRRIVHASNTTLRIAFANAALRPVCVEHREVSEAPAECFIIAGRVPREHAHHYFGQRRDDQSHRTAIVASSDALALKFSPQRIAEKMILFYDKAIPLSQQAIDAAVAGNWDLAAADYDRATELAFNAKLSLRQRGRLHYNFGVALAAKADFRLALRHLEIAETADDNPIYAATRIRVAHYQEQARRASEQREQVSHAHASHLARYQLAAPLNIDER